MGCGRLTGTLSVSGQLSCSLSSVPLSGELTIAGSVPSYQGETEITPSDEIQTLQCAGLMMSENITVNPIPSNYGRISWNGVTLTVS